VTVGPEPALEMSLSTDGTRRSAAARGGACIVAVVIGMRCAPCSASRRLDSSQSDKQLLHVATERSVTASSRPHI